MATTIYVATQSGLLICRRAREGWQIADRTLGDEHVTSVIAREGMILAGTRHGVLRSVDGGQHWQPVNNGLTTRHVRWLAFHPEIPDLEFAGTEPAGIFVSQDGADHWSERPEVAALRDQHQWMLPYSPEAGCVRGFAFHGQRAYAAVEVGGVLRSDDGGQRWALAAGSDGKPDLNGPPDPLVYPDVHDIAVHHSSPDLVFAATGGGLYRSNDGGATWALLYDCYCRALWLDPADPARLVFGPARGVGVGGRIEATIDGGRTWQPASDGIAVPWPRTMPERLHQIDDALFCVLDDGRLLSALVDKLVWSAVFNEAYRVTALAATR